MYNKFFITFFLLVGLIYPSKADYILVPMDMTQSNHLKAYGLAYWILQQNTELDWLLNYRGGSFLVTHQDTIISEMHKRGISYELLTDEDADRIEQIAIHPEVNMEVILLDKVPKIAVYSPKSKQPWDDAVTLVLNYAQIPYEVVFDDEVMDGALDKYDWLHLHHEDFTGQYGKYLMMYADQDWFISQKEEMESTARKYGFDKVSQLKLAVVKKIKDFCWNGGSLFAMCSAADTYDIALAAEGVDICENVFDGDPIDPDAHSKLQYGQTFAFKDFTLIPNPYDLEFSSIDSPQSQRGLNEYNDFFTLLPFSAKEETKETLLTQNHLKEIKGFLGQTTAFRNEFIKEDVIILAENKALRESKYICGSMGKGNWTFYGGHDPEDYQHFVNEAPSDLNETPASAGYRLILNNILLPAAKGLEFVEVEEEEEEEEEEGDYAINNMVLLLDVSGSMKKPEKLPLIKESLKNMLEELKPEDRITILVYSDKARVALKPTPVHKIHKLHKVIDKLKSEGKSNSHQGIELAYEKANILFDSSKNNRIILATDGEFIINSKSQHLVQENADRGIYLSIFHFSKNQLVAEKLKKLAQNGQGHFATINSENLDQNLMKEVKVRKRE